MKISKKALCTNMHKLDSLYITESVFQKHCILKTCSTIYALWNVMYYATRRHEKSFIMSSSWNAEICYLYSSNPNSLWHFAWNQTASEREQNHTE